jgi:hypothetical protein
MKSALDGLTLVALTIAAGVAVAAWIGFMAGIAINVARWFL